MPHSQIPDTWPDYVKQLGVNIQRQRLELNLSQEYVAYNANLSRFAYLQLEHGQSRPGMPSNPSLLNIMAVAQVLNVDLNVLLPQPWPDLRAR